MMVEQNVAAADDRFFDALLRADSGALDQLLVDDFILVDVLSGSEIEKSVLVPLVGSGHLTFDEVQRYPAEGRVRVYGSAAVVMGRTQMGGRYEGASWSARSRYTHVYIDDQGGVAPGSGAGHANRGRLLNHSAVGLRGGRLTIITVKGNTGMRILAISGSLRASSTNTTLVRAITAMAPAGMEITIYDRLGDLPHFILDLDDEDSPASVIRLRALFRAADGVLICTPEYAFGVPGSLKNTLDWTVSSGEINGKPVAAISASPLYGGGERRTPRSC